MKTALILAPHPDDETLGCGGTIQTLKGQGYQIVWTVVTDLQKYRPDAKREKLIEKVGTYFSAKTENLGFEPTSLGDHNLSTVIEKLRETFKKHAPELVFLPHPADAHSDHYYSFKAALSCLKSFRAPYVRRILCYETLSETNFALSPTATPFKPNTYVDISDSLNAKLEACALYGSEFAEHPFPRSLEAVKAQALLRGSESGCKYAEAFEVIYSLGL
jgi:N-acetylglucosamine malate deacetylase 1